MKIPALLIPFLAFPAVWAQSEPAPTETPAAPAAFCRFVPERSDDFAWENDRVAFRVYGPALRTKAEDSGIDCWAKRVPYPIIDKWYRLDLEQKLSYHNDRGEGNDFYHVGRTRGCGGTAIWHNGQMVLSDVYTDWKILENGPQKVVFQLTYEYNFECRKIQELKTITLEMGQQLFKSESVFTENGKPVDLEIAVGIATHNQTGLVTLNRDAGWMSVWRDFGKTQIGTGVVMEPRRITGMEEIKSEKRDESHAILTCNTDAEGRTVHYAGFVWTKAGHLTTQDQWQNYLTQFVATLSQPTAAR